MALSFLYLAFVRTVQILDLQRSDESDLAIEVVTLRHEVAVLRRHLARPLCIQRIKRSWPASAGSSPGRNAIGSSSGPTHCCVGIVRWFVASGPTRSSQAARGSPRGRCTSRAFSQGVRGQISVPAFGHEKSPPLGADVQFLASVDRPPF